MNSYVKMTHKLFMLKNETESDDNDDEVGVNGDDYDHGDNHGGDEVDDEMMVMMMVIIVIMMVIMFMM